ncbi:MAG: SsrA-binding protein SmpB [Verrucomicrobiota bacterium]|nr:SsrA-binding protein SmpB [Verrucomicrobiota bacterium]
MDGAITENRKARHDYLILDTYEAGLVLKGTEVKSIREGQVNISDAVARIEQGEVFLYNCDIQPYAKGNLNNHTPKRARKLLLNAREITKLFTQSAIKGNRLVALRLYWKQNRIKVALAVAKSKTKGDKRETLKDKAVQRDTQRVTSAFKRKHE